MNRLLLFLLLPYVTFTQTPSLVLPIGHVKPVTTVAISPDGKYILSGDQEGIINLWLTETGDNIFMQQYSGLEDLQFTSDSKKFLATSFGPITSWGLFSQDTLFSIEPTGNGWFRGGQLSSDEQDLFIVSGDTLQQWSLKSKTLSQSFPLPSENDGVFHPEQNLLLSKSDYGASDPAVFVLDGKTGKTVEEISLPAGESSSFSPKAFSSDGQRVFIENGEGSDGQLLVWSRTQKAFVDTLSLEVPFNPFDSKEFVALAPTGKQVLLETLGDFIQETSGGINRITNYGSGTMELWDLEKNEVVTTFTGPNSGVMDAVFSADGKKLVAGSRDGIVRVWDVTTGSLLNEIGKSRLTSVRQNEFFANDRQLLTKADDNKVRIWDLNSGRIQRSFDTPAAWGYRTHYSNDKSIFLSTDADSIYIWDAKSLEIKKSLASLQINERSLVFSTNSQKLAGINSNNELIIWELNTGKVSLKLAGKEDPTPFDCPYGCTLLFSKTGDQIYLTEGSGKTQVRETRDGKLVSSIPANPPKNGLQPILSHIMLDESERYFSRFYSMSESHFGEAFACVENWDVEKGQPLIKADTCLGSVGSPKLAVLGGRGIATRSTSAGYAVPLHQKQGARLRETHYLKGHRANLNALASVGNGRLLVSSSNDRMTKLWALGEQASTSKPQEIQAFATLFHLDSTDWVVTSPNGLFDASPAAMLELHYVVPYDQDWEVIDLEQLKSRYYEPGLLPKLLGYTNERMRPVETFQTVELYPKVEAQIQKDELQVQLHARNGGIGRLSIFINGKEVEEEANPLLRLDNGKRDSLIRYNLAQHRSYLLQHPDSVNVISLRAYNEDGWLKSRSIDLSYRPSLSYRGVLNSANTSPDWAGRSRPKLYMLAIGTSEYTGDQLDLAYADQDAKMMATAMQSVGAALFQNGDSLEVYCFSTDSSIPKDFQDSPIQWQFASKTNIQHTFSKIKRQAKAEDIIMVYLSGHGVSKGGTEETQFYYLTQGVGSEDDLNDPVTLDAFTISSREMTKWINDIPALKQVLIIDACNSGQVIENLTGGSKRLNSSQIRALDRMKDRTGMFILAGSASDKLSYEASEYGQGLLTYALLQGMLGVATRKDDQGQDIVDVMKLFQYARDQVPELAASVNGIQTPMLGFPGQAASFDIGILDESAKAQIPIGNKKPVMIRSTFLNKTTFKDDLHLSDKLEAAFRKTSAQGADAHLIYVDVNHYPNAYSLAGIYDTSGDSITIELRLFHGDNDPIVLQVPAAADVEELVDLILGEVEFEIY